MPLKSGNSKQIISYNIDELIAAGYPSDQASEIAYDKASKARRDRKRSKRSRRRWNKKGGKREN